MSELDLPKYLRVRKARALEDHDHLSARVYGEAAEQIERLKSDNAELNLALFHVENGLAHPDESVRKLIEAASAAKEK